MGGEAGFAGEVMEVGYESFEQVFEARVGGLGVYCVDVFGDVFDCEVFEAGRRFRLCCCCWCRHDG